MSSEFTQDGAAPHQEDTEPGGAGDHVASVIDVTTETFMAEVI